MQAPPIYQSATALHVAARLGNYRVVELLCKNPLVDIDLHDAYGNTPLIAATLGSHVHVVSLLLRHKVRVYAVVFTIWWHI